MGQRREAITQHLAERLCWEAARRDDTRVARRLYQISEAGHRWGLAPGRSGCVG
jgi:hypothetical protein